MTKIRVKIPKESYQILEFNQQELPGIAVINKSLKSFASKEVFSWHCSIMLHFEKLIENGMPDKSDRTKAEEFEDWLDKEIKGENQDKPNALFLGRITWNETRELIWRIYDPKKTNKFLSEKIHTNHCILPLDYRIDHDNEWELAQWHLENCE